jgi:hypothetical protein
MECASATPARPNIISRRCRWIIETSFGFVAPQFDAIEAQIAASWQYAAVRAAHAKFNVK